MDTTLLGSLSAFLRTLGEAPHPDEVARALVDLLNAPYGVVSVAIMPIHGPRMIVFGVHGYPEMEIAPMRTLPLDGDYPLVRAMREGEALIDPNETVAERYTAARRAEGSWASTLERLPDGTTISVPISGGGAWLGGCAVLSDGQREWEPLDIALLEAIGQALGMWLTHPDSGLPPIADGAPPELTSRQAAILALVAEDRSNSEIAHLLGFSESTVKQELQRTLRSLDVPGRREAAERAASLGLIPGGQG